MNERDFFVGNCRKVDFDFLVVAEIDDDRLIREWLRQFVNSYGGGGGVKWTPDPGPWIAKVKV